MSVCSHSNPTVSGRLYLHLLTKVKVSAEKEGNFECPRLTTKNELIMKKTMKLVLGIGLAIMVLTGYAQQRPERPSPDEMLKKVTKELSLNETQVSEWEAIHEKYGEQMKSDPRSTMPKMEAEIKEILTTEQWEKFEQMKPKRRPRKGN